MGNQQVYLQHCTFLLIFDNLMYIERSCTVGLKKIFYNFKIHYEFSLQRIWCCSPVIILQNGTSTVVMIAPSV